MTFSEPLIAEYKYTFNFVIIFSHYYRSLAMLSSGNIVQIQLVS